MSSPYFELGIELKNEFIILKLKKMTEHRDIVSKKNLYDLIVKIGDREYKQNRTILCTNSKFFEILLFECTPSYRTLKEEEKESFALVTDGKVQLIVLQFEKKYEGEYDIVFGASDVEPPSFDSLIRVSELVEKYLSTERLSKYEDKIMTYFDNVLDLNFNNETDKYACLKELTSKLYNSNSNILRESTIILALNRPFFCRYFYKMFFIDRVFDGTKVRETLFADLTFYSDNQITN